VSTAPSFRVLEAGPAVDSAGPRRDRLTRTARRLAWLGLAWHLVEATVAIAAGVVAGSVALVGFGGDSLIEVAAGLVVLWRFAENRLASESSERRAQQLIAVLFYLLALYVAAEATRTLLGGDHPAVSWVGIGLAAVTLGTMPRLATAKARVARDLGSSAGASESRQTMLCAYLSAGLLVGLGLNAIAGWWWADPVTALAIAAIAAREGRESWRGEACCTAPLLASEGACKDDCCAGPA
jgi:divalent metal cation (Fe/Co/Zn/Cd) transporter